MKLFKNPLSTEDYSDPFIVYDNKTEYYYFIPSCQSDEMTINRSKSIGDIITEGEKKVVYTCDRKQVFGPMWAPEMLKVGDRWYIYTSCQEIYTGSLGEVKRLLILKSKTEDPFDGFEFGSKPDTSIFAIDPTSAIINGKQYICYSEVSKTDGVQVLVIREMSDPLTFTEHLAEIARPYYDWELVEPHSSDYVAINEGAYFIQRNGRIFIVYSANGCFMDDYCLGIMEYTGGDICDASSWKKYSQPVFKKGNGVYGVGHAAFFDSPDKREVWCVYHCLVRSNPTGEWCPRNVCAQRIHFDETGFPVFGDPIGFGIEISQPSE